MQHSCLVERCVGTFHCCLFCCLFCHWKREVMHVMVGIFVFRVYRIVFNSQLFSFHSHRNRYFPSLCFFTVLPVCCSHFLFLIMPSDGRAPWKEGEQAALCVYSLVMRPHHFLPSSGKSLPLGAPHWHVCGRGPSLCRCALDLLGQNLAARHRSTRYTAWRWILGVATATLSETRPRRDELFCSCIRSESGCDRREEAAVAVFVMWNLVSRQKALCNVVQMTAIATELQLSRERGVNSGSEQMAVFIKLNLLRFFHVYT